MFMPKFYCIDAFKCLTANCCNLEKPFRALHVHLLIEWSLNLAETLVWKRLQDHNKTLILFYHSILINHAYCWKIQDNIKHSQLQRPKLFTSSKRKAFFSQCKRDRKNEVSQSKQMYIFLLYKLEIPAKPYVSIHFL